MDWPLHLCMCITNCLYPVLGLLEKDDLHVLHLEAWISLVHPTDRKYSATTCNESPTLKTPLHPTFFSKGKGNSSLNFSYVQCWNCFSSCMSVTFGKRVLDLRKAFRLWFFLSLGFIAGRKGKSNRDGLRWPLSLRAFGFLIGESFFGSLNRLGH